MSDDSKEELVRRAERFILDVVEAWGREKPWKERELTDLETQLKSALWELERARRVTGQVRIPQKKPEE